MLRLLAEGGVGGSVPRTKASNSLAVAMIVVAVTFLSPVASARAIALDKLDWRTIITCRAARSSFVS